MSLTDCVLAGPGGGHNPDYGHGARAELKIAGEQSGADCEVEEWSVRAVDKPPIHTDTLKPRPSRARPSRVRAALEVYLDAA